MLATIEGSPQLLSQWQGLTESADSSGGTLPQRLLSYSRSYRKHLYTIYMGSYENTICGAKVDGTRF